jgi:hypothetical protein
MSGHPSLDELSALLDGELPAERQATLEAHVRTCPPCARFMDDVRETEALLGMEPGSAPAGYHESFVARLRPRLTPVRKSRPWAWSAAAAAALIVVVLAPAVLREKSSLAPSSPPVLRDDAATPAPAPATAAPEPAPLQRAPATDLARPRRDAGFAEPPHEAELRTSKDKRDVVREEPPAAPAAVAPPVPQRARSLEEAESATGGAKPQAKLEQSADPPSLPSSSATALGAAGSEAAANEMDAQREQKKASERAGRLAAAAPRDEDAAAPSLEDLRREREVWRKRTAVPGASHEEARLRVVEASVRIFERSGREEDRRQALADADAYLADPAAAARDRVLALRRRAER